MKIRSLKKTFVLVTIGAGLLAAGCELLVDFDRTKIPVESSDGGVPDSTAPEASSPAPVAEAGADAEPDAETPEEDAGEDAASDAPAD